MLCRAVPAAIYRYNDFKKYADEDAAAEYMYGMECLFRFYSYGLENNFRVPLYKVGRRWLGVVEGSGTTGCKLQGCGDRQADSSAWVPRVLPATTNRHTLASSMRP